MMNSKNSIITLMLMLITGVNFASQKPPQKKGTAQALNKIATPYDEEINKKKKWFHDCRLMISTCEDRILNLSKIKDLLHARIKCLMEKSNNTIGKRALAYKAARIADENMLESVIKFYECHRLIKEMFDCLPSLAYDQALKLIQSIEDTICEQQKLIVDGKGDQTFLNMEDVRFILPIVINLRIATMKKIEIQTCGSPESKKRLELFERLSKLVSTNEIDAIKKCIAECIAFHPDYFKEKDKKGGTVLMHILDPSRKATTQAVRLIGLCSDINATADTGYVALDMAIFYGNKDHTNALFDLGASVDIGTKRNNSVLARTLEKGNDEITKMVLDKVIILPPRSAYKHLVWAAQWLQANQNECNEKWLNIILAQGQSIMRSALETSNPVLADRVIKQYDCYQQEQEERAKAQAKAENFIVHTLAQKRETEKEAHMKKQEAALEQEKKDAQKKKKLEKQKHANTKHRESEEAAQRSLYPAAAGAGAGAKRNTSDTNCSALKEEDEQAQEIARRKALAKIARKNKKNQADIAYAQNTKAAPIGTPLATNLGNLGNQLNPLLRVHLLNNNNPYPKNGRMLPLGIITAYLHNMPERAAANTR